MNSRLVLLLVAGTAILALGATRPLDPDDSGVYNIYVQNQKVGTEQFDFYYSGDSVLVTSGIIRLERAGGRDTLFKDVELYADALDFNLREYSSKQKMGGEIMNRGINLRSEAFTVYREVRGIGFGDTYERPLGRMYVLDAETHVLYDIVCRNLHGRSFTKRPLTMFVLGPRDTTIEVTVTDFGADTIRWGGGPVRTRRLLIEDGFKNQVRLWVSPEGHMLRCEEPGYALRVERVPPVKPGRKPSG